MNNKNQKEILSLNPRQKEAVFHIDGPLLILAGAGSGKTRVITFRIVNLLKNGISPSNILAVTFTNKAAKEMKERVKLLIKSNMTKGLIISTFHSLGLKILRESANHIGYGKNFSIYDISDQLSLIRHILSDLNFKHKKIKVEWILERISLAKNRLSVEGELKKYGDDVVGEITELVFPRYKKTLKRFNAVDFDDLLLLTTELFDKFPDILDKYRNKFKYIMIDEYQDTNKAQYQMVKLLAGFRQNICVVGDDDQSIYRWRGADLNNILNFEKDFTNTKIVKLEQNYRSYQYILDGANGLIKNNKLRKIKTLKSNKGPGYKIRKLKLKNGEDEASWIVNRINYLKYETKKNFEDFAVIYRSNAFSKPFEEALRRKTIPYTVIGGTSFFEKKEIKDLTAYLKVIANPTDELGIMRSSNIPKRGLGLVSLEKLAAFSSKKSYRFLDSFKNADKIESLQPGIRKNAIGYYKIISKYIKEFNCKNNMCKVFKELVGEINYVDYITTLYKTPQVISNRLENIKDFINSMELYEQGNDEASLRNFLEGLALTDILKNKKEKTKKGVTLISLHSAKGLEFPIVFIPGLEDDLLPHKKSINTNDGIEEERRLFYVGITRAMEELYVTYTEHRLKYGKKTPSMASRFLDEIPQEVISEVAKAFEENSDDVDNEEAGRNFFANMKKMLNV